MSKLPIVIYLLIDLQLIAYKDQLDEIDSNEVDDKT